MNENPCISEQLIGLFGALCDYMVDHQLCETDCPFSDTMSEDGDCEAWQMIHRYRNGYKTK